MSPPISFNKAKALEEAARLASQRKISQAIKQYMAIAENDPSDLNLLNTIGDLCIRDGNTAEALKQFQKLADAYTREGFLLKAVAIHKKISKLAPNDVEPLLKLAEHYSSLGLVRGAREHSMQALALCEKQALNHKALEILRRLVKQEPENLAFRFRQAESCVVLGQNSHAAQAYAEIAEIAYRRADLAAVEQSLPKACQLDPANAQANLLSARLALDSKQVDRAKQILQSRPALQSSPQAARMLLEAHLLGDELDAAAEIAAKAIRSGSDSGGTLTYYVETCLAAGNLDAALRPILAAVEEIFERNLASVLLEPLRFITEKHPDHLPALELFFQAAERAAKAEDVAKSAEALGNAYVRANRRDQAETLYRQLMARHPENTLWQDRLNGILQSAVEPPAAAAPIAQQARELGAPHDAGPFHPAPPFAPSDVPPGRSAPGGQATGQIQWPAPASPSVPAAKASSATALEQTLSPPSGTMAASRQVSVSPIDLTEEVEALAAIDTGKIEEEMTAGPEVFAEEQAEIEFYLEYGFFAEARQTIGALAEKFPNHPALPALLRRVEEVAQPGGVEQEDLAETEAQVSPMASQDGNGAGTLLAEEARMGLAKELPSVAGSPDVANPPFAITPIPEGPGAESDPQASGESLELEWESTDAAPSEEPLHAVEPEPTPAETVPSEEAPPGPDQVSLDAASVERTLRPPEAWEEELPEGALSRKPAGSFPDLQALIMDLPEEAHQPAAEPAQAALQPPRHAQPARARPPVPQRPAASFHEVLEELSGDLVMAESPDSPEKHYNLGLAFWEMDLVDEAIGEFQKVVRGSVKGKLPPRFLEACTLLASCFMTKGMPSIAVKWFQRALDVPGLDGDALLALNYDLADALERAGQKNTALEKFMEVYSENIDYRDVADRIRALQHSPA